MIEGRNLPSLHSDTNPEKHQKHSIAVTPMPIVKHITTWTLIWVDRGWSGSPTPSRLRYQNLKKHSRHPQASSCDVPINAHCPDWHDKKNHVGRGCKVACQAYSSIFHTHARASDLVKVFVLHAAPPRWSSLSLLLHTVDTDRVPVYCSGISTLPV